MPSRGAVGQAAEKLKTSLGAKLGPAAPAELHASVRQAMSLVDAFLATNSEDPASWEALKSNIRQCIVGRAAPKQAITQSTASTSSPTPAGRKASSAPATCSAPATYSASMSNSAPQSPKAARPSGGLPEHKALRRSLPHPVDLFSSQPSPNGNSFPWMAKGYTGRPLRGTQSQRSYRGMFDAGAAGTICSHGNTSRRLPPELTTDTATSDVGGRLGQSLCGKSMNALYTDEAATGTFSGKRMYSDTADMFGVRVWGGNKFKVTVPEADGRADLYSSLTRTLPADLDYTLSRHTLRPLAYASTVSQYDQMVVDQDKLAEQAEAYMKKLELEKGRKTRANYDEQYALVKKRLQEEVEAKKLEDVEMDSKLQRIKEEDEQSKREEAAAFATLRTAVQAQVEEMKALQQLQLEQSQRTVKLDRITMDKLKKQEAEHRARLTAQHRAQLKQVEAELNEALQLKATRREARKEEEKLYNAQCIAVLDAAQAQREADVKVHQDKLQAAFTRGGGEELMINWHAKMAQEREQIARKLAEHEVRETGRLKVEEQTREAKKKAWVQGLHAQVAYKVTLRNSMFGVKEQEQIALGAKLEALNEADVAARAEKQELARMQFAELKEAALERTQIVTHQRSHFPGNNENMWVHMHVVDGTRRGFTNLSVPERGNKIAVPNQC